MEQTQQTNQTPPISQIPNGHKMSKDSSIENFEPNVTAAFTYLLPPFTGIVFYLMEQKNKFVRFHAFQSILFGISIYVLWKVAALLRFAYIGFILQDIISLVSFVLWLQLMWKAYNKQEYELPYLGKIARKQIEINK